MRELPVDPLPPGQTVTRHFPVVGETAPQPGWDEATATITVDGLVAGPRTLELAALRRLPMKARTVDLHCVTGWSRRTVHLRGWPLGEVLAQAGGVLPDARYVRFVAASLREHDTSLPIGPALADTWVVAELDGKPLSPEHGGPLRTVTPGRYLYKSLKWLARIELLAEDRLGYWERESAYHNEADFNREQRFDEARTSSAEEIAALRAARDFTPWRGRVLLKARLGGWDPATRDLAGLAIKYSSLRQARLAACDLRGANLSLSNCEGADFRDADFTGADLEGASFAGADLRGARMIGCLLSATRFFRDFAGGQRLAARVDGLVMARPQGLLDAQAAFLRAAGLRWDQ